MDLVELNPPKIIARFDGHALKLRNFDLRAIVWATHYFEKDGKNGLGMMNAYLNNPDDWQPHAGAATEIIFHLISYEDREDIFQDSACYFKSLINKTPKKSGGPSGTIAVFCDALQEVFKNSFPDPPDPIKSQDGQKQPAEKQDPECWAKIFVEVAGSIGCSLDEFYALTTRQISAFRTQINVLKVENLRWQAMAMQPGVKFDIQGGAKPKKDIWTEEDIKAIELDQKNFMDQFPA